MSQKLLHIAPPPDHAEALTERLKAEGFRVSRSERLRGGIVVRVLDTAEDRKAVEDIVAETAPGGVEYGPEGAAATNIPDYRKGR